MRDRRCLIQAADGRVSNRTVAPAPRGGGLLKYRSTEQSTFPVSVVKQPNTSTSTLSSDFLIHPGGDPPRNPGGCRAGSSLFIFSLKIWLTQEGVSGSPKERGICPKSTS